jgi:hypothetical protein
MWAQTTALALLIGVAIYHVCDTRRGLPHWRWWRTAACVVAVWGIITTAGVALTQTHVSTASTGVIGIVGAPVVAAALLLLAAKGWPKVTVVSTLGGLARLTADSVRRQTSMAGIFPIDTDAAADIIRGSRMGVVSLAGGSPATDTAEATAPTLVGYLSEHSAQRLAAAAASVGARAIVVDPDEPNGRHTIDAVGIDAKYCYPPAAEHLHLPADVAASTRLTALVSHATVIVVCLDSDTADEAFLAWGRLAQACRHGREGVSR